MENRNLNLKNVKLARIKYFDVKHNGAEVNDIDAYAFLYEKNGQYANILNPERELPVYGRVPYTNTTLDGEDFGTKIVHKAGEVQDGPCYIIDVEDCSRLFQCTEIGLSKLKQYVLQSSKFFIDRYGMLKEGTRNERLLHYKKMQQDKKMVNAFNEFVESHNTDAIHK